LNKTSIPSESSPRHMWSSVGSMALCVAMLIAAEVLPVSLLTPIAADLGASSGMTGAAVSVSGFFAVVASLLVTTVAGSIDRRRVLIGLTGLMLASLVLLAETPNFDILMIARSLLGIAVGGFWSLATATIMRLVPEAAVPKALSVLYTGNAVATTFAAPVRCYLGRLIGWRGVFWALVPVVLLVMVWQWIVLPSMPSRGGQTIGSLFGLLRRRHVSLAMLAAMLTFGGAFCAFTYFRPFLEMALHATVPQLSMLLLGLGVAGFLGTYGAGAVVGACLPHLLRGLPLALALATLTLLLAGHWLWAVAVTMVAWGAVNSAIPVAWAAWLTQGVLDAPESGGGLMVAAIQLSIMFGSAIGGELLDRFSAVTTLEGGAALLVFGAAIVGGGARVGLAQHARETA
jgi:predicted MFS family arabinose efflux permease